MAQKYDPEEEEATPGLSDSTLTASDLAMLPDGANSSVALKLAEFKKKLNKIKGSTAPPLKAGLAASNLDTSGHVPTLKARLLIATAIEYGAGVLPVGMFKAKNMAQVRVAIGVEATAFLQRNDLDLLTTELKAPAKKLLDWWVDALAKEAELAVAATTNNAPAVPEDDLGVSIFA